MQHDFIVNGGGLVGLATALMLLRKDYSVAIVEPREPDFNWDENILTARVCALTPASLDFLQSLGVCFSKETAADVLRMNLWDERSGFDYVLRSTAISADRLGVIVENRCLQKLLWDLCIEHNKCEFVVGAKPTAIECSADKVTLNIDDNVLTANYIIGADGAESWLRQEVGIEINKRPYNHSAIVGVLKSEEPHLNSAAQHFMATGPLGILPAPKPYYETFVWSASTA